MHNREPDTPQETPPSEDDFRSDLIPGSQAVPDRSLFRERLTIFTPARLLSLLIVFGLFIIGWFLFAGPGKSAMEKLLTNLSERASIPTEIPQALAGNLVKETATSLPSTPTSKSSTPSQMPEQVIFTKTPLSSPIGTTPTLTQTTLPSTPTSVPSHTPTKSPTETPIPTALPTASIKGCVHASLITNGDVGKTLCVTGNVLRTESKPNSFLIILEDPKEAFYFLSYDRKWENLEEGKCVFATGKIMQLGNNPIMILDFKIPLEYCP